MKAAIKLVVTQHFVGLFLLSLVLISSACRQNTSRLLPSIDITRNDSYVRSIVQVMMHKNYSKALEQIEQFKQESTHSKTLDALQQKLQYNWTIASAQSALDNGNLRKSLSLINEALKHGYSRYLGDARQVLNALHNIEDFINSISTMEMDKQSFQQALSRLPHPERFKNTVPRYHQWWQKQNRRLHKL